MALLGYNFSCIIEYISFFLWIGMGYELWDLLSIPLKEAISICGYVAKLQSEGISCFCLSSN